MADFIPSEQQAQALEQINRFLESPGGGVFILKGYAGTGKTTLLQQLAKQLKEEKKDFQLLAPTGRAAIVLKSKTGLFAKTIHAELYSLSDIDGEISENITEPKLEDFGQMRLMFAIRTTDPNEKKIYIADEASMIADEPGDPSSYAHFGSGHLLSDLLHIVGTNKLIISGDPCQLPPITSIESPALSEAWMRKQGKVVQIFELTDILRQKESSGILQLATKVRKIAQSSSFPNYIKLPVSGIKENITLMTNEEQTEHYINQIIQNKNSNSIAICTSNFNCSLINNAVRFSKYNMKKAPLHIGDILMVTQNNHLIPLTNGDFVEVVNIGQRQDYKGISFIHVTVLEKNTNIEYETLLCYEILYTGNLNLRQDQQRMLMIDFSQRMRKLKIKPKSEAYYEALSKDPYLNSLRANFGYAVTCHKSQGGEWDYVYLFLNSKMYGMPNASLSRWWYTGITRAKEHLYMVNDWWVC